MTLPLDAAPFVGILPYRKRFGRAPERLSLGELVWPLGAPPDAERLTLSDLRTIDHVVALPHTGLYTRRSFGTQAKVSVMFLEPRALHWRHMTLVRLLKRRFHRILTADETLLRLPNAAFFTIAGGWVPDWREIDLTKTRTCSLIASSKNALVGHKLRHDMVKWSRETQQDVEVMGRGYTPFDVKSEGLAPYRYSLVIENAREKNYFTEKLIDAILCNTVPIYWGCPNIGEFFDTRGMILCETMEDMQRAVATMSDADYAERAPALDAIRDTAAGYVDFYERAARTIIASEGARVTLPGIRTGSSEA